MQQIVENISSQPTVAIIFSLLFFLFNYLLNHIMLSELLKMHRSKSAVRKLKMEYTFWQRLRMKHFKNNCRHAIKFCNKLIFFQKFGWLLFAICLIISLLYAIGLSSAILVAWISIAIFLLFDAPSLLLLIIFVRPLFFSRINYYTFEKYHNTQNHNSLF